ncbi:MAG TPA: hypothetical protein VLE27_05960, partial [Thermoanaerobaculia bacterium]|nr:hypothetical protein [Thermoanaerobaculia bacterium]
RRVLTLANGQLASDIELLGTDPPVLDPLANVEEVDESVEVPEAGAPDPHPPGPSLPTPPSLPHRERGETQPSEEEEG